MPDFARLFFALWPDDETRQSALRLAKALGIKVGKRVPPENLHVTLVFLGNVDVATGLLIQRLVDQHHISGVAIEPFTLSFDRLSYWNAASVIALTCRQPAQPVMTLAAMLASIATDCGIATDKRPYQPHITLVRDCAVIADYDCEPIIWRAESFCLMESCRGQGAVCYKPIRQWPLIKPV